MHVAVSFFKYHLNTVFYRLKQGSDEQGSDGNIGFTELAKDQLGTVSL